MSIELNDANCSLLVGSIFNLFLEVQPWNWVDYIVEKSKTVSITDKTPQVLDAVLQDGVRVLIQNVRYHVI